MFEDGLIMFFDQLGETINVSQHLQPEAGYTFRWCEWFRYRLILQLLKLSAKFLSISYASDEKKMLEAKKYTIATASQGYSHEIKVSVKLTPHNLKDIN